jgi:hypothetical protein
MDRKSTTKFRKSLEARHRELCVGVAKTQKELLTAQLDHGKDEGDRANTSLAKEMSGTHLATERSWAKLRRHSCESVRAPSESASIVEGDQRQAPRGHSVGSLLHYVPGTD